MTEFTLVNDHSNLLWARSRTRTGPASGARPARSRKIDILLFSI